MSEAFEILAAWKKAKQPVKTLRVRLYVLFGDWSQVDAFLKENL